MGNPDLLNAADRTRVLNDIGSNENDSRKREAQRRFDVYRGRQDRYILEVLQNEFSVSTVQDMRKILSINMTEKIIHELSSLYKTAPKRQYSNASENEELQIDNLYELGKINSSMKLANKYYNLFDDVDVLVVPKDGRIVVKPMTKMGYDIIPDASNPEKAFALVISTWDEGLHRSYRDNTSSQRNDYYTQDRVNQSIADDDDRMKTLQRFIVWTPDIHFTMNGHGTIVSEVERNPIGRLPIVNIAREKDNQYFVRRGSGVTNFAIEFSACISDLANIVKLQGYAQAVVTSTKQPSNLKVGPNSIIWLQQDENSTVQPKFEFVSPSPDIANSLEFLESLMKLFLSSRNIDPKSVSSKAEGANFSSGVERLLSMIDRFEASRDDADLFLCAELELFDLVRDWSNVMQGVSDETRLVDDLNITRLNDDIVAHVKFNGPEAVKTDEELLGVIERRLDNRTMSRIMAIEKLEDVDTEKAEEIARRIDEEEDLDGEVNEGPAADIIGPQPEAEDQPEGTIES